MAATKLPWAIWATRLASSPTMPAIRDMEACLVDWRDAEGLRAAHDGGEDLLRVFTHHDEDGVGRWLFEDLEEAVACCLVHQLGLPDYHDLLIGLVGLHAELGVDGLRGVLCDEGLLACRRGGSGIVVGGFGR